MTLKRTLTILLTVMLLPAVLPAQSTSEGGLTVRSDPQGALAILKGEATVTGVTPTTFRYPFLGEYRLTVRKRGFEDYNTYVVLDPVQQTELDVVLNPKTRFKAALRSMMFPGWGQRYTDQKTKSLMFLVLSAGAAAAYLIADHNFGIKYDRYASRLEAYDDALASGASYSQVEELGSLLAHAQQEAYDSEDTRRITISAAAIVWGLNVLDALLFSPREKGSNTIQGLTIAPSTDEQTIGLTLSHGF